MVQWDENFLGSLKSKSHVGLIGNIPFYEPQAKKLLEGSWFNDDIIDAYLTLCGYVRRDFKFLPTQWYPSVEKWGNEASSKSISWVSNPLRFFPLMLLQRTDEKGYKDFKKFTWYICCHEQVHCRYHSHKPSRKSLDYSSIQSQNPDFGGVW